MKPKPMPCRVTISEKRDHEYWEAFCVCGWADASALAVEMLEAAWAHYNCEAKHVGSFLFIDVKPEGLDEAVNVRN